MRRPYVNRRLLCYICAMVTVLLNSPVLGQPAATFFAPAPDLAATLDPNGIYPQGQMISFGFYSAIGQNNHDPSMSNVERLADEGFTIAGPYYNQVVDGFINEAAAAGIRFTHQIRRIPALDGVSVDDRPAAIAALTDQQIIDWTTTEVQKIFDNPTFNDTVVRWSLQPEEFRHWKSQEMRYLQLAYDTTRQVEIANGATHRPFWMYEPNNRSASDLVASGANQDIVSRGVYMTTRFDRGDQRSGFALHGFEAITGAAATLGNTPQAVFQLSEDFTDPLTGTDPVQIRKVLRHDVYLGLVNGIKSLQAWSMFETRPNLTTHNEQFEAYGSVAKELTGGLDLQKVFLFGEEHSDLAIVQTLGQSSINYDDNGTPEVFDAISKLNVAYEDDRYLFLVNSAETQAEVVVAGLPGADGYLIEDLFAGTLFHSNDNAITVALDNLGVKALRFTAALTGDLDTDGFVGISDLNIILANWNQSVIQANWAQGDVAGIGDGFIGISDLNVVLSNWNAGTPPPVSSLLSIPEPTSAFLWGAVGLPMLRRGRKIRKPRV